MTETESKHLAIVLNLVKPRGEVVAHLMGEPSDVDILHAVLGFAGEVAELVEWDMKWKRGTRGGIPAEKLIVNLIEELGDCLWYMALLHHATGIPRFARNENDCHFGSPGFGDPIPKLGLASGKLIDYAKKRCIYGRSDMPTTLAVEGIAIAEEAFYVIIRAYGLSRDKILEANIAKLTERHGAKFRESSTFERDTEKEAQVMAKAYAGMPSCFGAYPANPAERAENDCHRCLHFNGCIRTNRPSRESYAIGVK